MTKEIDPKEKLKQGWIHLLVTFEIIGKPAKHVDDSLRMFLDTVKKEERIIWLNENIGKAEKTEGDFFGSYAEVDLLVKNLETMTWLAVNFTPASVEVIEPTSFKLTGGEIQNWNNDLLAMLHDIGLKFKQQTSEYQMIAKNFSDFISNSIILSIARGNVTAEMIMRDTSLTKEIITQQAAALIKDKKLALDGNAYRILPQATAEPKLAKTSKAKPKKPVKKVKKK